MNDDTQGADSRALAAGLIIWPKNATRSCRDCKYLSGSACANPKVAQPLDDPPNQCCNFYDSPGMTQVGQDQSGTPYQPTGISINPYGG